VPRHRLAVPPPAPSGGVAPLLIGSSRAAAVAPVPVLEPLAPTVAPQSTVAPQPTTAVSQPTAVPAPPPLPPSSRVVIPRIGLDTKVVDVGVLPNGEMETAAYAVGRLNVSADAGDDGNVVLAGHNDVLGEVFRRLPELQVGDEFQLFRGAAPFRYRVEGKTIVREEGASEAQRRENARWMEPADEPVATLISCYPYRVDTHRVIVRARLVA
jgi:sortase A